MRKPTIWKGRKSADSFAVTANLISAFVFAIRIVHFLFFLNQKFQASSLLLCLYSLVCVRPVRKPLCWFSHETAQLFHKHFSYLILSCIYLCISHSAVKNGGGSVCVGGGGGGVDNGTPIKQQWVNHGNFENLKN